MQARTNLVPDSTEDTGKRQIEDSPKHSGRDKAKENSFHLSVDQIAVSPGGAAHRSGLGRTTIYKALKAGDLKSIKIGSRRLIMVDALKAWLARHGSA